MTTEDIEKYKKMVDSTGDRLGELCEKWSAELAKNEKILLNEEIAQKMQSVIGKSQLLRNSKFKQFSGFLRDAEEKTIGKPVKLDDIRGFWETIYLQVDEVNRTFDELEQLKANNYVTVANAAAITSTMTTNSTVPSHGVCPKKSAVKKATATSTSATTSATSTSCRKPVVSASSNLKNFISAQRERKKLNDVVGSSSIHVVEKVPSNGHA